LEAHSAFFGLEPITYRGWCCKNRISRIEMQHSPARMVGYVTIWCTQWPFCNLGIGIQAYPGRRPDRPSQHRRQRQNLLCDHRHIPALPIGIGFSTRCLLGVGNCKKRH
jgi:hypothetical protein